MLKKYKKTFFFKTLINVLIVLIFLNSCADSVSIDQKGIVFFGDIGYKGDNQNAVAASMENFCQTNPCNIVLGMGDIIYPNGVSSLSDPQFQTNFEIPYKNIDAPFYLVLGNHDVRQSVDAFLGYSDLSEKWNAPSRYYVKKLSDDISIIGLDTNDMNSDQRSWLQTQIDEIDAKWKIVFAHHPLWSFGENGENTYLQGLLLPIISNKINFYLSGHDHDKQVLKKQSGFTPIVCGTGSTLRDTSSGSTTLFSRSSLGFCYLLIEGNRAELKVLNTDGAVEFLKVYNLADFP